MLDPNLGLPASTLLFKGPCHKGQKKKLAMLELVTNILNFYSKLSTRSNILSFFLAGLSTAEKELTASFIVQVRVIEFSY